MSNHDTRFKWWEFTLAGIYKAEDIRAHLKRIAKKWAFQRERAPETGYEHYQGKFELVERSSLESVIRNFQECGFNQGHLERSYSLGDLSYVTKEQTRIAGPWSYNDPEIPKWLACENPEWYPWQQDVINFEGDERTVKIIIDLHGCSGKSYLANWLSVRGQACKLPITGTYKDVMRAVCDRPTSKRYFLDIPRAEQLNVGMIAAIESIKDGHVWDDRYRYTEKWMEPPVVVVYTNQRPETKYLSKDRWRMWVIENHLKLRELEPKF